MLRPPRAMRSPAAPRSRAWCSSKTTASCPYSPSKRSPSSAITPPRRAAILAAIPTSVCTKARSATRTPWRASLRRAAPIPLTLVPPSTARTPIGTFTKPPFIRHSPRSAPSPKRSKPAFPRAKLLSPTATILRARTKAVSKRRSKRSRGRMSSSSRSAANAARAHAVRWGRTSIPHPSGSRPHRSSLSAALRRSKSPSSACISTADPSLRTPPTSASTPFWSAGTLRSSAPRPLSPCSQATKRRAANFPSRSQGTQASSRCITPSPSVRGIAPTSSTKTASISTAPPARATISASA